MPHHHPGNVAKLEAIVAVLRGQVLTLETEKQSALRQGRQATFEQESAVTEIIQSSSDLHYILKKVEKVAKIGETLGLLPIDDQMRARVQYSQQPDQIAQVPLQERARYEREIVEVREISEAMLKELERRVQEVEQAEEAAALWKQRTEALQGRLAASDEEYSKLEKRLVSAANQLRHEHEHELSQRAEENVMLRKKTIEVCDEMSATKRQQHILLECLKEVTCSFLVIGGDRVKEMRQNIGFHEQVQPLVHTALLDANAEEANSITSCLDDLMAQACVLQRHLNGLTLDYDWAQQNQHRYLQALRETSTSLLCMVGPVDMQQRIAGEQYALDYEALVISIRSCLAIMRSQAQSTVDETEHRVVSLEDSLNTVAIVSKMRALMHTGVLERIHVISTQQALESKAMGAERERFQKTIEMSTTTIRQLEAALEKLTEDNFVVESEAKSKSAELAKIQHLAEQRQKNMHGLEDAVQEQTFQKESLSAELRAAKKQQAQLAVEMEKSSAGKFDERNALLQTMTSMECSVESFLCEIEGKLEMLQDHQALLVQELNARGQKLSACEANIKRLFDERTDNINAGEKASSTIASLHGKLMQLEEGDSEMQRRLKVQLSYDSHSTLIEQQLQIQLAVLQGQLETRQAEFAASDSRFRLLDARNAHLQAQLAQFSTAAQVRDKEHQQELKFLTTQAVDQEINLKRISAENLQIKMNLRTAYQDSNSALAAIKERERILKSQQDERCTEHARLLHIAGMYQRSRDEGLGKLVVCEQVQMEVVELYQVNNAHLQDSSNAEDSKCTQLSSANMYIADLQGNHHLLQQLYETRQNELDRLHQELAVFRANDDLQLEHAHADLSRFEKTEAALLEALLSRDQEIARMQSSANEMQDAVQDLMAELQSERAAQTAEIESFEEIAWQLKESAAEKSIEIMLLTETIATLETAASNDTQMQVQELLDVKTKEVFDLARTNMIAESRVGELQRKLADLMVLCEHHTNAADELHTVKIQLTEANEQMQQGNSELGRLNTKLQSAQLELQTLQESVDTKDTKLTELRDSKERLQARLAHVRTQASDSAAIQEILEQKEAALADLKHATECVKKENEELRLQVEDSAATKKLLNDMQHRMQHADSELVGMRTLYNKMQSLRETEEALRVQEKALEKKTPDNAKAAVADEVQGLRESLTKMTRQLGMLAQERSCIVNELRDTQAALFESQVTCNKFEARSQALAYEADELKQIRTQQDLDTTSPDGWTGSVGTLRSSSEQVESISFVGRLSPQTSRSVCIHALESSRPVSPDKGKESETPELIQTRAQRATRAAARSVAPDFCAVVSPQTTEKQPQLERSAQKAYFSPPPSLPTVPPPLPFPPGDGSGQIWPRSSPTKYFGGDASTNEEFKTNEDVQDHPRHTIGHDLTTSALTRGFGVAVGNDVSLDSNMIIRPRQQIVHAPQESATPVAVKLPPRPPVREASVQKWMSTMLTPTRPPQVQGGIGVVLTEEVQESSKPGDGDVLRIVLVIDVIPGLPAHIDSGIQIGSQILEVDRESVRGLSLDAIRGRISGAPGSWVTVKYETSNGNRCEVMLIRAVSNIGSGRRQTLTHHPSPSPEVTSRQYDQASSMAKKSSPDLGPLQKVLLQRTPSSSARGSKRVLTPPARSASPPGAIKNLFLF